jgi:methylthioribose-1-phosphate isomerase
LAVLAAYHHIPFYVAAPRSTIDLACPSGDAIPIERRSADEVGVIGGQRVVPEGVQVDNRAFDVTPAELVSAIITEDGVVGPPYDRTLA